MKKNEFMIIKGLDIKELREKLKTFKKEIADLSMDKNRNILKDLKSIDKKRKELAQVLTVLNQKQTLAKLEQKVDSKPVAVNKEKVEKVTKEKPVKKVTMKGTKVPKKGSKK